MLTLLISIVCAVGSINIMLWLYESVFIVVGGIFLEWLLAFTRGEKPLAERYGRWAGKFNSVSCAHHENIISLK